MGHTIKDPKIAAAVHALGHTAAGLIVFALVALPLVKIGLAFDASVLLGGLAGGIALPLIQEGVIDLKWFSKPVQRDQLIDTTNYFPAFAVASILVGPFFNVVLGFVILGGSVLAEYSRAVYR